MLKIGDLLSENGDFYELEELNNKYNIQWNFLNYLKLWLSIPLHWRNIIVNPAGATQSENYLYLKLSNFKKLKTKDIYWWLIKENYDTDSKPKPQIHWEEKYNISPEYFEDIYTLPYKSIRLTEIQALQYKILYRIFNCNEWLHKIGILDNSKCRFCNETETLEHYFFQCSVTNYFWSAFLTWWNTLEVPKCQRLLEHDIIFGVPWILGSAKILNCCILLGKFCIYKHKSLNKQPNIYQFHCELHSFLNTEEAIAKSQNMFLKEWDLLL